jgi:hypothetical protein
MDLIAFRLANYETPMWAVKNFSAGRYNDADSGFTQYLSLHPLTPWAEILRNEDRRRETEHCSCGIRCGRSARNLTMTGSI